METKENEPTLLKGGLAVDDRGEVTFVNDFAFEGVKRFYAIRNHEVGFVRAWHGHRREAKFMTVTEGDMLICAVRIDDWDKPDKNAKVHRFVLSARTPSVLHIPAGFANGSMSLSAGARLMVFSTSTLQDSLNDDIRFEARLWNPWKIEER